MCLSYRIPIPFMARCSAEKALKGIINLVSEIIEGMQHNKEKTLVSSSLVNISGKFQSRILRKLYNS